jgi:two-component system response regulator YesN
MLYKVLIVDDELLVRNHLRTLIDWERHGFEICGEATNGETAKRLVETLDPRIVILDVNMPVMDGVRFSAYLGEQRPAIKMIVLSSYDNYEYVRETLKNGARDYLLKHRFDAAELLKILTKVKREIEAETRQQEALAQAETERQKMTYLTRQDHLKNLVLGIGGLPAPEHPLFPALPAGTVAVVVLQVENYLLITGSEADKSRSMLSRSGLTLCQQIIDELGEGIVTYLEQGKFVIALALPKCPSEARFYQSVQLVMNRIANSFQRYLNLPVVWGVAGPCHRYAEFAPAYRQAAAVAEGRIGPVQRPESRDASSEHPALVTVTIAQEKNLLAAIEMLDLSETHAIIDQIFASLRARGANYLSLQMTVNELITIVSKAEAKSGISRRDPDEAGGLGRESLQQGGSMEEIQQQLKIIYANLIEQLTHHGATGQYSKYIREALDYIAANYRHDLSLNEVSDKIRITPSYLSRLFRDETGMSFVEYLNHFRVQKAKKFIENGERKMKSLYEKVGFNSYNYFFKVFKELTGCTPMEYVKNYPRSAGQ